MTKRNIIWLNKDSRNFLERGYLQKGVTPEQRIREIAEAAEKILKIPGFADKFEEYMASGFYSLSSPIWANFGNGRGLAISCVTGDTSVVTFKGIKLAEDIRIGDYVLTHKNRFKKVTDVIITENSQNVYFLHVNSQKIPLKVTGNHKILTNHGWKRVDELDKEKDLVATITAPSEYEYSDDLNTEFLSSDLGVSNIFYLDGLFYCSIDKLEKPNPESLYKVYDFTVEEDHSFVAERIVVHNCNGSYIDDTMDSILEKMAESGMLTKYGAGTSGFFGDLRSRGTPISKGGVSSGPVHFMELFDNVTRVVSQSNVRRGSFAAYLPVEHPDIEEFLSIREEGHRIQDMSIGVCVTDAWMKSMIDGDKKKRSIWAKIIKKRFESGYPYLFFTDTANKNAPKAYKDKGLKIHASNLCVSSDTKILTKKGYITISDIAGQEIEVWNGKEFSNVQIVKTGENKSLTKVEFDDGTELYVTPEHKFYVGDGIEKRTSELEIGDRLVEFNLPVITEGKPMFEPYTHGVYCAKGFDIDGKKFIYVNEIETGINKYLAIEKFGFCDGSSYAGAYLKDGLDPLNFVPIGGDLDSKLRWLEGYFDFSSSIEEIDGNFCIKIISEDMPFLSDIKLMLQTMGIFSNILRHEIDPEEEGFVKFYKLYSCILNINSDNLYKLVKLGFSPKIIKVKGIPVKNDDGKPVLIKTITQNAKVDDTYCCNEPKEHRIVVNGHLTGNCSEIMLHSSPEETFVCNLSSLNIAQYDNWKNTDAVEILTYFLDAVMEDYIIATEKIPFLESAHNFAKRQRALGIGVLGWHTYLQSKMIPFESFEAKLLNTEIHKLIRDKSWAASKEMAVRYGEPELLKGYGMRNVTTCVTKDTLVLTDTGHCKIIDLIGKKVNVWNGFEYSEVIPYSTGISKLLKITLSNGRFIKCTHNHIFKVIDLTESKENLGDKNVSDVEASNLKIGDCMSRFVLPVIGSGFELEDAYTKGLIDDTEDEHLVPENYSFFSKLEWLAGAIDSNGYVSLKGIDIFVKKYDFALSISNLLQTLGCHSSILENKENQISDPHQNACFFVRIPFSSYNNLIELGLKTERNIKEIISNMFNGHADFPEDPLVKVVSIEDAGEEETYCFTEDKNHTGIFNGIYTGQCAVAPTTSSSFILGQVSPSVEPLNSNYFVKDLAKGKFTYKNPKLVEILQKYEKDDKKTWESILLKGGSVQHLDFLSDHEKEVFKTFGEISQKEIIIQASARQKFIDQGQSINLTIHPKTPAKDVNALLIFAWENGIKSLYYQRGTNPSQELGRSLLECKSCEA